MLTINFLILCVLSLISLLIVSIYCYQQWQERSVPDEQKNAIKMRDPFGGGGGGFGGGGGGGFGGFGGGSSGGGGASGGW